MIYVEAKQESRAVGRGGSGSMPMPRFAEALRL